MRSIWHSSALPCMTFGYLSLPSFNRLPQCSHVMWQPDLIRVAQFLKLLC